MGWGRVGLSPSQLPGPSEACGQGSRWRKIRCVCTRFAWSEGPLRRALQSHALGPSDGWGLGRKRPLSLSRARC